VSCGFERCQELLHTDDVYPQVSQFWTYDPGQFVAQPAFSRDYPSKSLE